MMGPAAPVPPQPGPLSLFPNPLQPGALSLLFFFFWFRRGRKKAGQSPAGPIPLARTSPVSALNPAHLLKRALIPKQSPNHELDKTFFPPVDQCPFQENGALLWIGIRGAGPGPHFLFPGQSFSIILQNKG